MTDTQTVLVASGGHGERYHLPKKRANRAVVSESLCGAIDAAEADLVDARDAKRDGLNCCGHCKTKRNQRQRMGDQSARSDPPTSLSDVPSWRKRK